MLVYLTKYIRYPNIVIVEAEETGLTYTSSRDCVVGRQVVIVVYLPETLDLRLTPDIGLRSLCEAKQEKQFFILNLFCVFHWLFNSLFDKCTLKSVLWITFSLPIIFYLCLSQVILPSFMHCQNADFCLSLVLWVIGFRRSNKILLFQLLIVFQMFKILSIDTEEESDYKGTVNMSDLTTLEALAFGYDVQWPISLILNRKSLAMYQMLFRHLFNCKHV